MSTADFLIAQMAGEADLDAVLSNAMFFDPSPHSLARSPEPYVYDNGSNQALPYLLSGLSGEHNPHSGFCQNRLGGTEEDLYLCNTGYEYSPAAFDPIVDTASGTSNVDNQTPPSRLLPPESLHKESKKLSTKTKKKAATIKPSRSSEEPAKARRQSKREAPRPSNNQTREPKANSMRDRSLERNRISAFRCRKRKKLGLRTWNKKKLD